MKYQTPGGLYPTCIALHETGAYVIAHPIGDGPVDADRTLLFSVQNDVATLIRDFGIEITGIAWLDGSLFAVDGYSGLYRLRDGEWRDLPDVGDPVPRINALRVVGGRLHGLTSEGVICLWQDPAWVEITPNDDDTYLFDLALEGEGKMMATGDNGFLAYVANGAFQTIDVPTNASLTSVFALSRDTILVTGWNATALMGNADQLRQLDVEGRTETLMNTVRWDNRILIAANEEILELKGTTLSVFETTPAIRLTCDGSQLWKQYGRGVDRYENGQWINVPLVANI
ncbi:hypothetical protein [Mesorhizobium sp. CA12]|uniref:hypothetical protein n=1 Tax=Mesorhizobium sp. CA12 TaxID=2876644 RepID=UPI001CC98214|nr:hypothetical protein [Mesorhizobium sp. CA12]MBZ9863390.1 hypothetical protein [Mesorhizobium sp. CA12]